VTLVIPSNVLYDARIFFEAAGSEGCEGTGLLAGEVVGSEQQVGRFFAPDQRAERSRGCWVEVTETGKLQLASSLAVKERWLARIHSHPSQAFHSTTDDANPFLTADGSWSIVVPYFGLGLRRGLAACAVHLRERGRWRLLQPVEVEQWVQVAA